MFAIKGIGSGKRGNSNRSRRGPTRVAVPEQLVIRPVSRSSSSVDVLLKVSLLRGARMRAPRCRTWSSDASRFILFDWFYSQTLRSRRKHSGVFCRGCRPVFALWSFFHRTRSNGRCSAWISGRAKPSRNLPTDSIWAKTQSPGVSSRSAVSCFFCVHQDVLGPTLHPVFAPEFVFPPILCHLRSCFFSSSFFFFWKI